MAALQLQYGIPVLNTSGNANIRRKVILPGPCMLRIKCATSALALEFVTADDGTTRSAGTLGYESQAAGETVWRRVLRGEVAISADTGSSVVELTADSI